MITAPELYDTFSKHDAPLSEAGFNRSGRNNYKTKSKIALKLVPGKWGWTEEYGWSFFVRLMDIGYPSDGRPHQPYTDIYQSTLIQKQLIEEVEVQAVYSNMLKVHPGVQENLQTNAFAFYDTAELEAVLDLFLPPIAKFAKDWEAWRLEQRKQPAPQPRSPQELQRLRTEAVQKIEQAGFKLEQTDR